MTSKAETAVNEGRVKTVPWHRALLSLVAVVIVSGTLYSLYLFFTTVRAVVAQTTVPLLPNPAVRDDLPPAVSLEGHDLEDLAVSNERLNILLLGIDRRPKEPGPFRTDTMILLSFDLTNKTASMLSLPRDLWVTIPGYWEDRINTAHVIGDARGYPGGGIALAKKTVQHNLGVPVHRAVRIDFQGFVKLIDAIGGVTIDVPSRVYDARYPDNNYGYMVVDIPAGVQQMDGERALQYARSRHGSSDYDRMARQQQVILAARDKILSLHFNLAKIPEMLSLLGDSIYTDLPLSDILVLADMAMEIKAENIRHAVIDATMTRTVTLNSGAMVEVADWAKVRNLVQDLIPPAGLEEEDPDLRRALLADEGARIELRNGSLDTELAAKTADALREQGFNVIRYGNAERFDYLETTVFDRTGKTYTVEALADVLKVNTALIEQAPLYPSDADIVVILGRDYAQRAAQASP